MIVSEKTIRDLQEETNDLSAEELLEWLGKKFETSNIILASSLGAEDQVLTDMTMKINPRVLLCTLDTGRLHEETYRLMDRTSKKYGFSYRVLFPDYRDVESMVSKFGQNLFYESIEKRKQCCAVRKVHPLRRALEGKSAWICGLRKEQADNRSNTEKVEWDNNYGLYKINPLSDWTESQVWEYIHRHQVPYNTLHDKGYVSIGCAPCTRAIQKGESPRAGRWWWEETEHKECGLHVSEHVKEIELNGLFKRT